MSFKPLGHYLSLRFRPPQTKTKTGLYLPRPIYSQVAEVLTVGHLAVEELGIKVGDVVMVHKHGDGMEVQSSLWYHYMRHILTHPEKLKDFKVAPVIVTDEDIIGKWSDRSGMLPLKRNVVLVEHIRPHKTASGIHLISRHRGDRKTTAVVEKASRKAPFKKGDIVLLGKFGGVYFIDKDGKEKVLAGSGDILGKFTKFNPKWDIMAEAPREQLDPNMGIPEYFNA